MALPSISVTAHRNSDGILPSDEHIHRRVFIGPMPEKVVLNTEAQALKHKKRGLFRIGSAPEEDDMHIIKENAFKFFVHTGGRLEDWGEDQEQSTRHEMLQRWRNSEWGNVWGSRRKKESRVGPANYWVGGSFEIGRFLGIDVLQETGSTRNRASSLSTGNAPTSKSQSHTEGEPRPSATTQDTFVSNFLPSAVGKSPTEPGPSSMARDTSISASSDFLPSARLDLDDGTPYVNGTVSVGSSVRDTSSTELLKPSLDRVRFNGLDGASAQTEVVPRPIIGVPSFSVSTDGQAQGNSKGKGKLVHYEDIPEQEPSSPVPPSEVLERTGDAVEGTSAGATASGSLSPKSASLDWGDVVMRGNGMEFPLLCRGIDFRRKTGCLCGRASVNPSPSHLHSTKHGIVQLEISSMQSGLSTWSLGAKIGLKFMRIM